MTKLLTFSFIIVSTFLVAQNNDHQVEISSYTSIAQHKDLLFMNEDLKDVKVVGLGEATHGTREFNLMYLKMFRYLVEVHDFNTLFLEEEFVPSSKLDEYVKCEENCTAVSASILTYWVWQTEEMNDLIEWIKTYNKTRKQADKISIVGIDIQSPKIMCEELNSILEKSDLEPLELPKQDKVTNQKKIDKYRQAFSSNELILAYESKKNEIDETYLYKYSILLEYLKKSHLVNFNPKRWHLRDLSMAKNILSYISENTNAKGMFISHNGHLIKFNKGKKNEMKNNVLAGGVLDKELGDKYYYILQDFDGGCFNAYHRIKDGDKNDLNSYELSEVCIERSIPGSIGAVLRDENKTITFIKEEDLYKLKTSKDLRYHSIGAVFKPLKNNPSQSWDFFYLEKGYFDACLFHQSSTITSLLPKETEN